jgi:tRNA pseudouridine55 synthase
MQPRIERVDLAVDGLLLVDKPEGCTSHDVVDAVRRHFQIKKVGHGGTLDPMATGLLVLLLGKATRLFDQVTGDRKVYEGVMKLGVTTDSHDRDGKVLCERDPSAVTEAALQAEMAKWRGEVKQVPPMVSALKKNGKKLYELARQGKTIEREPRAVTIHLLELLEFNPPLARIRMDCSKGTYVRTLAHDIGEGLGCGAHLIELRRTASGPLRIEDAHTLSTIVDWTPEQLVEKTMPIRQP